jgi:hypothetical protein
MRVSLQPSATSSGSTTTWGLITPRLTKRTRGRAAKGIRASLRTGRLVRWTAGARLVSWSTRSAASAGTAASLCVRRDLPRELPEVIARGASERPDRRLLTPAGHAADTAHGRRALCRNDRRSAALRILRSRILWILDSWRRRRGARRDELPLTRFREGILVLLSEVFALYEHVDVGGKCARLGSVSRDRARVLEPAEDPFFFFLALGFVSPDRHGDRHEDGHDGHHHEQRSHGVSAFAAPIGLTT